MMRNRCPICGKPSANSAYQLCMNCHSKYTVEKDGREYKENPCPDVECITTIGNYGGHRHIWSGSHDVLDIYWKKQEGKTYLSITPLGGEEEAIVLVL